MLIKFCNRWCVMVREYMIELGYKDMDIDIDKIINAYAVRNLKEDTL